MRRLGFLVLAAAQKVFRQCDEALNIALQFAAILERLLNLIRKIRRAEIEAPPGPVTEAD